MSITLGERRVAGGELPSWRVGDLVAAPRWRLAAVVVGPAAAIVAVSLGRGDGVLGPLLVGRYGIALVALLALSVALQAVLLGEMARYTLATGEPIFTAFLRTRPGRRVWGPFYAALTIAQLGHLGRALLALGGLGAIGAIAGGLRASEPGSFPVISALGIVLALAVLAIGSRSAANAQLAAALLSLLALALLAALATVFARPDAWTRVLTPAGPDALRDIGPLAGFAYLAGGAGVLAAAYTNWTRDAGRGMAAGTGTLAAITEANPAPPQRHGMVFEPSVEANGRFAMWRWLVERELWTVFAIGALLGGTLWIVAVPTSAAGAGPLIAAAILLLLARQIVSADAFARLLTDLVRAASLSRWAREVDPRLLYYGLLAVLAASSLVLLTAARGLLVPLFYVEVIVANAATSALCFHTYAANRALLARPLRASARREFLLVLGGVFFGAVTLAAILGSVAFTRFVEGGPIRF